MPKIYDNIENHLKGGLLTALESSFRADFYVGYFNLRGWKLVDKQIDHFSGEDHCCRLLVGMQRPEEELLRKALAKHDEGMMDNSEALTLKKKIAHSFRQQLTFGFPTTEDKRSLQKLKQQLSQSKLKVKLFLNHPLHAKLYLLYREDKLAPLIGYVGSSNLTMAGLSQQGEQNTIRLYPNLSSTKSTLSSPSIMALPQKSWTLSSITTSNTGWARNWREMKERDDKGQTG